jgi:hypothetical protein
MRPGVPRLSHLSAPTPAQVSSACPGSSKGRNPRPAPPLHSARGKRMQGSQGWCSSALRARGWRRHDTVRKGNTGPPTFRLGGRARLHLQVLPGELKLGALLVAVLSRQQLCSGGWGRCGGVGEGRRSGAGTSNSNRPVAKKQRGKNRGVQGTAHRCPAKIGMTVCMGGRPSRGQGSSARAHPHRRAAA